MTLSAQAVSSFKEIYTRQFGEQLLDPEAEQKALSMLKFFRLVYSQPAPKGWQKKYGISK
jgi:hypothetical protein